MCGFMKNLVSLNLNFKFYLKGGFYENISFSNLMQKFKNIYSLQLSQQICNEEILQANKQIIPLSYFF